MPFFLPLLVVLLMLLDTGLQACVICAKIRPFIGGPAAYVPVLLLSAVAFVTFSCAKWTSPYMAVEEDPPDFVRPEKTDRIAQPDDELYPFSRDSETIRTEQPTRFTIASDEVFPQISVSFSTTDGYLRLCEVSPMDETLWARTELQNGRCAFHTRMCTICGVPKPPGSSHCEACQRCVFSKDHHCAWLGTCVGARNYLPFFSFLVSVFLLLGVSFGNIAMAFAYVGAKALLSSKDFSAAVIVVCVVGLPFAGFVIWLIAYHVKLIIKRETVRGDILQTEKDVSFKGSKEAFQLCVFGNAPAARGALGRLCAMARTPNFSRMQFRELAERSFAWAPRLLAWGF